jgi:O-antigen ligase
MLLIAFYVMHILYLPFTEDKTSGLIQLEKKLALLLFPISFLSIYKEVNIDRPRVIKYFVFGVLASTIICYLFALYNSLYVESGRLIFNAEVEKLNKGFFESVKYGGNYFFSDHLSLFVQSSYFGLYHLFTIAILINHWDKPIISKIPNFYPLFFSFVTVFFISSRASLLSLILIVALYLILVINQKSSRTIKFVIICLLLIISIIMALNPRTKSFFSVVIAVVNNDYQINPKERYGELRPLVWKSSLDLIRKEKPYILGVSPGDVTNKLIETHRENGFTFAANEKLNTHNNYFQVLIGLGVPGLSIFLAILFFSVIVATRHKDHLLLIFLFLMSFNFLFENVIERFFGIIFFGFFLCLLIVYHKWKPQSPYLNE